jgi:acyl transferase domain-containing protein
MSNHAHESSDRSLLKRALFTIEKLQAKIDALEAARKEPIAIVGMACRAPNGANDPEALWHVARAGLDATREMPAERYGDIDFYYDPDPAAPVKTYTRRGAFLDQVDQFDPHFFSISPREAACMDPVQRIFLEVCWEALENAGQAPSKLAGSRTGIFVGAGTEEYSHFIQAAGCDDTYAATGNIPGFVSGRVSYVLGLTGPTVTLHTTCSSSLAAVHMAIQSLRTGDSDIVLAGGVNLLLSMFAFIALCKIQMLSRDGRCKTFDASADGYGRSEGCGVVVLKRLSDATRNGDNILAVIRGSAIRQNGATTAGITVTNGPAQQMMIRDALANAGIEGHEVDYFEAHGTGTDIGDPIEVQAVAAVFGEKRPKNRPLILGSIKANIGHSELAAGVTGLIKVVLCLQHKEIPPYPSHLTERNPKIPWDELPVVLPTEPMLWPSAGRPRIAGVSSLGGNGLNVHVIVEEAKPPPPKQSGAERPLHLFTLSAKREKALRELAERHARHIAERPELPLADACFTVNAGRSHFKYRLALVAGSNDDLREQLAACASGHTPLPRPSSRRPGAHRIAFLFTGQGSQYIGMGRQLYETQPTFRAALDRCDALLRSHLERPLLSVLYPEEGKDSPIDETGYTQPALFALEYALSEMWRSWGIEPSVVMGHSVGEYVAACVAGVFSLEHGLMLIAERARMMQALPRNGEMIAVFTGEERVREALEGLSDLVSIAAVNGPDEVVVSGRRDAVEAVIDRLLGLGVKTRPISVSHAFHSPLMDPMLPAFERVAAGVSYDTPRIRFISNLTGRSAKDEVRSAAYWRDHVRAPVRFAGGMQAIHEHGCDILLEIGARPTLTGLVKRTMPDAFQVYVPSLRKGKGDWETLLESVGMLYVSGVDVNWDGFDRDYPRRRLPLPTYSFQRQRYWFDPESFGHPEFRPVAAPAASGYTQNLSDSIEDPEAPEASAVELGKGLDALLSASPEERSRLLEAQLQHQLASIFKMPAADLDPQEPLLHLGFDSLMAVDLKRHIEKDFSVILPLSDLLEGPSVADLTLQVMNLLSRRGSIEVSPSSG